MAFVAAHIGRGLSREDRDDALQEFAKRFYVGLKGLRDGLVDLAAYRAWLWRIATRVRADVLRQVVKTREHTESLKSTDSASYDPPNQGYALLPMESAEQVDLRDTLLKDLAQLDEISQQIVILRLVQDLSAEDTARLLDLDPGKVGKRLFRARNRLSRMKGTAAYGAEYNLPRREVSG